ncbi:MAG: type I methionyl aminopeptidase [Acidobacteriota bacterium]
MNPRPQRTVRIQLHGPAAFDAMRRAGQLAAKCLDFITPHVKAGITTLEIDRLCHDFTIRHGAVPAPLNYHGFPRSICTSRNEVICHGIPGNERLAEGDILNIDVTPIVDGWHGDSSRMFLIGDVSADARDLVDTTYEAMMEGISLVRPGLRLGDLGHAIQSFAEARGYAVVRNFCGHGTGRTFHTAPAVFHFGRPGQGPEIREGMFFTVEPMLNLGSERSRIWDDGWTAVTEDGKLSAQFEHTVGVTRDGVEIFTLSPGGLHRPPYG